MAVLLLNATYEPLAVIAKNRAISLWLRDRVDGVTDDTIPVRGVSRTLQLPTVLRLRRFVNVPRRGAHWSRQGVLRRDNYQCIYCGIRAGETQKGVSLTKQMFTIDHVIPQSRGGRNSWMNTAAACQPCNHRKGNRTPHEAGMTMLWEPKTPRVDYWVVSGDVPEAWKLYLPL